MKNGRSAANQVLASLPPSDYKRLKAQLVLVTVGFGQALYEPGNAGPCPWFLRKAVGAHPHDELSRDHLLQQCSIIWR